MSVFPDVVIGTNYSVPPDFDPIKQPIYFLLKNGTLFTPTNFAELDRAYQFATQWCVVYGCIIGAAVMTLLHVLALTPLIKRRTLIYWLNVVGLCQILARAIFDNLFFTRDRFETYYVFLSGDSNSVPTLHRIHSTFSIILSITTITTVEVIFFVQGRAILSSLPRKIYLPLISALVFFGLVAVTVRLIYAVYNVQDIWVWNYIHPGERMIPKWCEPTSEFRRISRWHAPQLTFVQRW
jgi:Fungal pheromone mating factor STE2 GPCR